MEYGEIVEESIIKSSNDATLDEVWNVYTIQKVTYPSLKKCKENKEGNFRWWNQYISSKDFEKLKETFI